ncbi:MAG: type II toxin-antitoxin system ParD family antitoxin [Terriglobia bacterium]
MNVSLTPQLQKLIGEKVRTGRYNTASEVVREGLRLLEERDKQRALQMQRFRKEIQVGLDQVERGQASPLDIKKIKSEGRKRLDRDHRLKRVG